MTDLWPADIEKAEKLETPVSILKQQASLLGERTNQVVIAKVAQTEKEHALPDSDDFAYDFFIAAPALGNYRYRLFTLTYGIELYPLVFKLDTDIKAELAPKPASPRYDLRVNSKEEYLEALKKIFAAHKTVKLVRAIIGQSGN